MAKKRYRVMLLYLHFLERRTRLSSSSYHYSVQLSLLKVNQDSQSFIPFSGKLWSSLPASIFPTSYDFTYAEDSKTFICIFWQISGLFKYLRLPLASFPFLQKKCSQNETKLSCESRKKNPSGREKELGKDRLGWRA